MPLIRPELAARLRRWRELLLGAALALAGLWLILRGARHADLLVQALGAVALVAGVAVALAALPRLRLPRGGEGPGVVSIREGRIAYMGPVSGGVVNLDALDAVAIEPVAGVGPVWILRERGRPPLRIPAAALGAEALADALAPLPGFDLERAARALADGGHAAVIWRRVGAAPRLT